MISPFNRVSVKRLAVLTLDIESIFVALYYILSGGGRLACYGEIGNFRNDFISLLPS